MTEEHVVVRTEGRTGVVTLNRPKALNALTHDMVGTIAAALDRWEHDPEVATVVITGAGERGLCAGGDIRSIYEDARTGGKASAAFWRDEYRLNARIARYPKPYVAVMDGIVMGGGVGVSAHGSVRIVTERSKVAMPETGIGFVPDVGGTYLLALAPGELGTHLALTGAVVGARDALLCGLADHFVPADELPAFLAALRTEEVPEVLGRHVREAPPGRWRPTGPGSTTVTPPRRSRRSWSGCSPPTHRRPVRRRRRSWAVRPSRSRSPSPRCAAPVNSGRWSGCSSRSTASRTRRSPPPIWWRASGPR